MKGFATAIITLAAMVAVETTIAQVMKDAPKDQKGSMGSMQNMPMGSSSSAGTHHASGVVKKTDPAKGTVTLDHGAVASLKWPAMTMDFEVADKKMLDNLKPGSKVQVEFKEKSQGKYVITGIQR